MDPMFVKGGLVCPCVTHALACAAVCMYRDQVTTHEFSCEHGNGQVSTDFQSKMLGNVSGIFFTAQVDADGISGTQTVSFLMRETELLAVAESGGESGVWIMHRVPGQLRDIPDDMLN
jgi:hypothetical protein